MKVNVGNLLIDLSTPVVMTIINVTPDSFYGQSRTMQEGTILERIASAVDAGTAILDIGGYSSRPGAKDVSPEEELQRISLALEITRKAFPQIPVSIDTFRAEVADRAITHYGPCIINDITGGEAEPEIIEVATRHKAPFIAMHMRGTPQNMQQYTDYRNLTAEITGFFRHKIRQLTTAGVEEIILDLGFGFSKTLEQNYELLAHLSEFIPLGYPILAGISRKSMIYKSLDIVPEQALNGTSALHWECLRQGANILRVHDTVEAMEVIKLFELYQRYSS